MLEIVVPVDKIFLQLSGLLLTKFTYIPAYVYTYRHIHKYIIVHHKYITRFRNDEQETKDYSANFKLAAVANLDRKISLSQVARTFGISRLLFSFLETEKKHHMEA